MIRLFIKEKLSTGRILSLDERKAHYLIHVMRQKEGSELLIFNGVDGEFKARLTDVKKKTCLLEIMEQTKNQTIRPEVILCPALIKKENMTLVLEKATELGVTKIYPLITERTVVRGFNIERANLIVEEAAEQCERLDIPQIFEPILLKDLFLKLPAQAIPVFLTERGNSGSIVLSDIKNPAFIIGPEGGFTEGEISFINAQKNIVPIHLGDTILRAETASIAILGAWVYNY
ncbi:MAG: 16S rRNA (uracil(1498)-N(3))-methyltransferase [Alphaproteobacteria bacterium]|nr:16S rRNA (uracil(1498)-N(3))-methyltransferase [Alphaproteobacteria bacterium]